jgi:hypothetical protein
MAWSAVIVEVLRRFLRVHACGNQQYGAQGQSDGGHVERRCNSGAAKEPWIVMNMVDASPEYRRS